ncbi:MAG: tyrosine-type recombinase/integrase [Pseudomonadota bacterium]
MARLTDVSIRQMRGRGNRYETPDTGCPGLYLVIQPNGSKSWAVRYRSPIELDGKGQRKAKKLTLGPCAEGATKTEIGGPLSLRGARKLATDAMVKVKLGIDPASERRAAVDQRREEAKVDDTIEAVFDRFMVRRVKKRSQVALRQTSLAEDRRMFKTRIAPEKKVRGKPSLRGKRIQDITKRDILQLLDSIVDEAPVMANRVLALLRRFFNWCIEQAMIDVSPCAGVLPPGVEKKRERVLNHLEIVALWRAAEIRGYPFGKIAQLLLLTGQRVDEVREARRAEFDLTAGVWTIAGQRTKNGVVHDVPLSPQVINVIKSIPEVDGGALLFGRMFARSDREDDDEERAVSGMSRATSLLRSDLHKQLLKDDPAANEPEHWTLHDLRRTLYTGLQELGFSIEIAEAVTNHISGTRAGVARTYARHRYAREKREALGAWGRYVDALVSGKNKDDALRIAADGIESRWRVGTAEIMSMRVSS